MEMNVCSFCKKGIKKGDFIAAIGKRIGYFNWRIWTYNIDPARIMEDGKTYCKSCFDKQFKK